MAKDFFSGWNREEERRKPPPHVPNDVAMLFEQLALQVWNLGYEHYSASSILHRIRWHFQVDMADREFKCNDHWSPWLSRWFLRCHPECGPTFFWKRIAAADFAEINKTPTD